MNKKLFYIILGLIFVTGLIIRILTALDCEAIPDYSDMGTYNRNAVEGNISIFPPPGYPLMLRTIYYFTHPYDYTTVFIIQAIISALTIPLICWVTCRISTLRAGLIAAGITAIYPNFIVYNLTTLTETMGVLFCVLFLAVLVAPVRESRRSVISFFVLLAAVVFKPVFVYFWPGILASVKRKKIFLLTTMIIVLPIVTYGIITGTTEKRAARAFYKTYNAKSNGKQYVKMINTPLVSPQLPSSTYIKAAFEFIRDNKWKTIDIIYNKISFLVSQGWDTFVMKKIVGNNVHRQNIMNYAYLPVMFLGFLGMIRFYDKRTRVIALPAVSYMTMIILLAIFKVRYRLLIEPNLIIFTSILIGEKWKLPGSRKLDSDA